MPALFTFLEELEQHNDRDWFAANKARYEADVKEPALAAVQDPLRDLLPARAREGGADAGPVPAPGARRGVLRRRDPHPDGPALQRLRETIVADPEAWTQATHAGVFGERYRIWGDALKRAPAGFDPAHPLVEDLKRKDFIAIAGLEADAPLRPGFEDELQALWGAAMPYLRFLGRALDVEF
jgi:uncharacterized protein (DUF2461 family)